MSSPTCKDCPQTARVALKISTTGGGTAWITLCAGHANRFREGIGQSYLVEILDSLDLW